MFSQFEAVITSDNNEISMLLFKLLEGHFLVGPSLDIFKVAMLNKKFHKFVKSLYNVKDFKDFACLFARQEILKMFENKPDLSKYIFDDQIVKNA